MTSIRESAMTGLHGNHNSLKSAKLNKVQSTKYLHEYNVYTNMHINTTTHGKHLCYHLQNIDKNNTANHPTYHTGLNMLLIPSY